MNSRASTILYRLNKLNDGIAIGFRQIVEFLSGTIAIRLLGVAMPHNGLDDGTGPAVVQTIVGTGETTTQTAPPQRCGAAPASTDVVRHKQAVLNQVGVRPDGLVGVLRQHAAGAFAYLLGVCLRAGIHPHIVRTCSPRRTVTLCTTNLAEQLLATLDLRLVQITGSRHGQAAVPHHKLIVLLVAHLLNAIIGRTIQQILLEGLLIGDRRGVEHLVNTIGNALVGAVGIVWIQNAGGRRTMLLDVADHLRIFALSLGPRCGGVEPMAVAAGDVGDVPDGIGTGAVLQ